MAPTLCMSGSLKICSSDLYGLDYWWAAHPDLEVEAKALSIELEDLIGNVVLQLQPNTPQEQLNLLATRYHLCQPPNNPDELYIHLGSSTPVCEHGLTISMRRNVGAGVQRRGGCSVTPATCEYVWLTAEQVEVLEHVLDFVGAVAMELRQDYLIPVIIYDAPLVAAFDNR